MTSIAQRIAEELTVAERQVAAAVELLDGGATVPFIARYRKEATGALDDTQLRTLEERLRYLRELEERRKAISIPSAPRTSSTRRSKRRSTQLTVRRGSRTSICPSNPSGAPGRRSPARTASNSSRCAVRPSRTRPAGAGGGLRQTRLGSDRRGGARRRAGDPG